MITSVQFHKLFPSAKNAEGWCKAFSDLMPMYGVNTKERVAMFLAQCGHESGGWTRFEENLNYSAKRLVVVFPKYFNDKLALEYERQPAKIASRVYGGRMGNGPEESGDGFKYRGRGPIQLTGRNNYLAFSTDVYGNTVIADNPDAVAKDVETCLKSAFWFWKVHDLNNVSDVKVSTKRINGGTIGLADRQALYERIMAEL